jgi:hypothetical protein
LGRKVCTLTRGGIGLSLFCSGDILVRNGISLIYRDFWPKISIFYYAESFEKAAWDLRDQINVAGSAQ